MTSLETSRSRTASLSFKQKTAYEMRISDWSSDVCSSDLLLDDVRRLDDRVGRLQGHFRQADEDMRQIRISTEKIDKRAERIREVEVEAPEQVAAPGRPRLVGEP